MDTRPQSDAPLVSVVIPTRRRPQLVARAIDSVLAQSFEDFEIIVIVDGADDDTLSILRAQTDPRLHYIVNPTAVGGGEARNIGVRRARGQWIALLDDDDEWLPEKLEVQLDAVLSCDAPYPVGFCRVIARSERGEDVWPRRPPRAGEPLSEYLLARRSLFAGEGMISTSTLVVPRSLFELVPFDPDLRRHQDLDWVLRAAQVAGVQLVFSDRPLVIWHMDESRVRISTGTHWRHSYQWATERRAMLTSRAFAAFLLVAVSRDAARTFDWRGALFLWREAWHHGRPAPIDVLLGMGVWLVPPRVRRRLHDVWFRLRRID